MQHFLCHFSKKEAAFTQCIEGHMKLNYLKLFAGYISF